ncbi:MAG: DUF6391 domain-containing protein [Anaerolineae bacterium]|nr:DUF6391 domain-containing protein [Anaerolineae bacterium]
MLKTLVYQLRRNHALEHATINLASQRYTDAHIAGVSDPLGFTLYTTLSADKVVPLVREALAALKAGQSHLAVHHNCGTNVIVTATLTTLATLVSLGRRTKHPVRRMVERLPYAVLLNALALLAAPSAGQWMQNKVTTDPQVEDVEIGALFTRQVRHGVQRIRVRTDQS